MRRLRAPTTATTIVLAIALGAGCTVRPRRPSDSGGPARHIPAATTAEYAGVGPVPEASIRLRGSRADIDTYDVLLPPRVGPDASPEARATISMRWWRPVPVGDPRPAVVISPILAGDSTIVADFALGF